MKNQAMLLFTLVLLFSSCCKEDIIPDPITPPSDSNLVLWRKKLNPDSSNSITGKIVVYSDRIVYVNNYYKNYSLIQCRSISDGSLLWTYDNPHMGETSGNIGVVQTSDEFIINSWGYFFNLNNKEGLLTVDNPEYKNGHEWPSKLSIDNKFIYAPYDEPGIDDDYAGIARRGQDNTSWEFLYREEKGVEGYSKDFTAPTVHHTPQGDTILFSANRMWHFPKSKGRTDFIAYSLKNRDVLWRKDSIDENSSVVPPIVWDGKVYFQGLKAVHCYDIHSGDQIWKYDMTGFQEDVGFCHARIIDGRYYIQSSIYKKLYCLDARTGSKIWINDDNGGEARILQYFDGQLLFSTHGYLMSVDAISGKTIWKRKSKDLGGKGSFDGSVPIGLNERDSVIYVCDKREIMALKIPKKK